MNEEFIAHEELVKQLNDPTLRAQYAEPYDDYKAGLLARILGNILVLSGDFVYGMKPSYGKFKAIEIIARIPYQSWEVASYTLLTALYGNEKRAIELAKTSTFSRMAQDNETMHVVVITQMAKRKRAIGPIRHSLIPLLFALFYFWAIFILYMISKRSALELNYLFENHAYEQYSEFLLLYGEDLKNEPANYDFLAFFGRNVVSEYEFFQSVRNDELIHRNRSIRELEARGYCIPRTKKEAPVDNPQPEQENLAVS